MVKERAATRAWREATTYVNKEMRGREPKDGGSD